MPKPGRFGVTTSVRDEARADRVPQLGRVGDPVDEDGRHAATLPGALGRRSCPAESAG